MGDAIEGIGLARLLASASFRRSREVAAQLAGDAAGLRQLLADVERKVFAVGSLTSSPRGVHVDIAGAMVEAHLEELTEPGLTAERRAVLTSDPRPRVVIAALHYLVTERDVVPDWLPTGHLDDLLVLQWASDVARGDLPLV
ncbi:DUF1232 domain-containing protein [Flexivirga sp. ID2601S]|uniref:DUF1232 domain-containing protein n=1 Tax=Flexivirga aerilata TaxID=1656889 RepID=A0A849ACJ9_9MICO|nr:YkvA family protein [Flexivirga aerilata]NNG38199.1 DUF1232 domain-containing protein [Flexivirga aerilata]